VAPACTKATSSPTTTAPRLRGGGHDPPGIAIVEPGNPIGGAFTLPQSFINVRFTRTVCPYANSFGLNAGTAHPLCGPPGSITYALSIYYNGPGKFGPNFGATGPTRVVFPTTMGNPYPNYATGNPVTPTTTFDGKYDFTRAGSINVTPGPRRFGGTYRMFYTPESFWYQLVGIYAPAYYKGYFRFYCRNNGVFCTPDTFVSHIGDITTLYRGTRYLLNVKGTGTGDRLQSQTAKATTAAFEGGTRPTTMGVGTPDGAPASYIAGVQQYINLIHPWTTGFASVHNPIGSPNVITPQLQGYDIDIDHTPLQTLTVTHIDVDQIWNQQLSTITTTTTYTYKQYLKGVGRIVSMVRPRLIHTYRVPLNTNVGTDLIVTNWQVARLWAMKVFFVPEPSGMLMLSTGLGLLVVLHRVRGRR